MNIDEIKAFLNQKDNIIITQHTLKRFRERSITIADVCNALNNGEIIEQYPSDFPYPSCLVTGMNVNNAPLHIVCGIGDNKLWIITAYYPSSDSWENDFKTRKGDSV